MIYKPNGKLLMWNLHIHSFVLIKNVFHFLFIIAHGQILFNIFFFSSFFYEVESIRQNVLLKPLCGTN